MTGIEITNQPSVDAGSQSEPGKPYPVIILFGLIAAVAFVPMFLMVWLAGR